MSLSRISTSIDYDRSGKQVSWLAVPSSENDSAYATITIPIAVFKNGEGPTLLLTGGVHGDEYEGPVALTHLVRELEAGQIQGRLIVVPTLNLPAAMAGLRCSPIDGLNLNRAFPGNRDGSVTEMIAHYVSSILLPISDVVFDLHSGGNTLEYQPEAAMFLCDDAARQQRSFELVRAFDAPVTLVDQVLDETGQLGSVAEQAGILNLTSELGGAGRVDPAYVKFTKQGIRNVMIELGMLDEKPVSAEAQGRPPSRLAEVSDLDCYVMCPDAGLYQPFVDLGAPIEAGQLIGQVLYMDNLDKDPCPVLATRAGFLLCKRPPGRVMRGDNIAIIAQDLDPAKYGLKP